MTALERAKNAIASFDNECSMRELRDALADLVAEIEAAPDAYVRATGIFPIDKGLPASFTGKRVKILEVG